jgi:hypothetical protein
MSGANSDSKEKHILAADGQTDDDAVLESEPLGKELQ